LALDRILVFFTAGATTFDLQIVVDNPAFVSAGAAPLLGLLR